MDQVNRLYCAQCHLLERFSEIVDLTDFADLRAYIASTIEGLDTQINDTAEIFEVLKNKYSFDACDNLLACLESDFNKIYENTILVRSRDLALLNYLQNIQNNISAAFQIVDLKYTHTKERIAEIVAQNATKQPGSLLKQSLLYRLHEPSN
ncbi:hypothetical protein [Mucilaginibacter sp.]